MGLLSFFGSIFSRTSLPAQTKFLIAGLGNPGEKYLKTRHNIGFRVADALCDSLTQSRSGNSLGAQFYVAESNKVVVIKPTTFMNHSGDAINAYLKKLSVPVSSLMVLVDDFNIPLGRLRMRPNGSDGGHNGLKSISAHIGTEYPRLRIGIGPLPKGTDVISFVLGNFTESEEALLSELIPKAVSALKLYLTDGVTAVMNKYNS